MGVQDDVHLDRKLRLVVIRNDQLVLADPVERFIEASDFETEEAIATQRPLVDQELQGIVARLRPNNEIPQVLVDPLRQFGEPVIRSVPTEIIAEQVRAGEPYETIAELYELEREDVEAAVRFELTRLSTSAA